MQGTLRVLNELERTGVLGRYAIGGAMGATFYVEPLLTFDLDVFVVLPRTRGGLPSLASLYEALRAEHLVAICLQTGRDKDRERVRILRAQATLDRDYLAAVLSRHQLEARWNEWKS